ncbi:MAG: cell division protein FtsZ, partial [Proteobacteria bacterium]|nr:cell division protein FtsZ [Pseudomonadota bacterium]
DEILHHSVKGITDLIMMPGHVNLDFADVKTTMQKAGKALMGIGVASGENRAIEAAERAISHPLLEDISISGAKGVLMNITSSSDLTLDEMTAASDRIYKEVGDDAEIIWGQTFDEELGDEIRITVIATGIGSDEAKVSNNIHHFDPVAAQPVAYQQPAFAQQAYAAQSFAQQAYAPQTFAHQTDPVARGQLRTPTQEELSNWNEFDNPVIIKHKKAVGDDNMINDYGSVLYDNDDLEVPTFLRRKAD